MSIATTYCAHYVKSWTWSMRSSRKNLSTYSTQLLFVTGEIGMSALVEHPWCGLEKWIGWHVLCHACGLCAWIKTPLVSLSCATVWGRVLAREYIGTSLTPVVCHLCGMKKIALASFSSRKCWAYWLYANRFLKSEIGRGKFRFLCGFFISVQLFKYPWVECLESVQAEQSTFKIHL